MFELIKKAKKSVILSLCAIAIIIYLSGNLGIGAFLRNHLAFGYGGGLGFVMLPEVTAQNQPLYLPDHQRAGRLFQRASNGVLAVLEVPPLTVSNKTSFELLEVLIDGNNTPCENSNYVVGNRAFHLSIKDPAGKLVTEFPDSRLSITLTYPEVPVDTTNLGIYYLNNNNQWVLGQKANFSNSNEVTFQVATYGTFAVISSPGLSRLIEAGPRCSGQVLGVKQYADGELLRTCDGQVYIVEGQKVNQAGYVALTKKTYRGKTINDVDFEVIVSYLGTKNIGRKFADGELLRTCDWRIFRVENQELRYIPSWQTLHDNYFGQKINNIDYWVLSEYKNIIGLTPTQQVLGAKQYATGTLVRTPDGKIYIIENQGPRHIISQEELKNYGGKKIYDVSYEVINSYNQDYTGPIQVLGVKKYADGTLLRTRDWKVYLVQGQTVRHIATLAPGPTATYQGQKIYDVDYGVINQYNLADSPSPTQQVLGVKQYADGTLLRTPDGKIYIIGNQVPRYISSQDELKQYGNKKIYNVDYNDINDYGNKQVLGVKRYADGTILKTPDWKVYIIENQKAKYIATVASPQMLYDGKPVYNVDYEILAQY
jgi:hypothetical protein